MVPVSRWRLQNKYVGDFFIMLVTFNSAFKLILLSRVVETNYNTKDRQSSGVPTLRSEFKMWIWASFCSPEEFVTDTPNLTPTQSVSNFRHQHQDVFIIDSEKDFFVKFVNVDHFLKVIQVTISRSCTRGNIKNIFTSRYHFVINIK